MMTFLISLLMVLPSMAYSNVDFYALATAVAIAESGNKPDAVGDAGKARGAYQMWRIAWDQASKVRKAGGLKTYPWAYAHDAYVSRIYAIDYLRWCYGYLEAKTGRKPKYWEVYAAYARGPSEFYSGHNMSYEDLPLRTKRAITTIAARLNEPLPR